MKQVKRFPSWFNINLRPLTALKLFTATITAEHEDFKKDSHKKRKKNERRLENFKTEFAGTLKMFDDRALVDFSPEQLDEIDSIDSKLKTLTKQTDRELEKINRESAAYEDQIKQDYKFQRILLSKASRNFALFTIVGLVLFTVIVYVIYKFLFPSFGNGTSVDYYAVIAQIMPALLIALYLTEYGKSNDDDKRVYENSSVWNRLISEYRLLGIYAILQGEVACLVAIGRDRSGLGVMLASLIGIGFLTILVFAKMLESDGSNK